MPPINWLPIPYIPVELRLPIHEVRGDLWRLVDRFDSIYYGGLDIRVYMQEYRIEDVVGLTYEIREQVVPVYGYASYTYDTAVRGQRIIEGSFTVIFKKPYALVERVAAIAGTSKSGADSYNQTLAKRSASRFEGNVANLIDVLEWSQQQRMRYWGTSIPEGEELRDDQLLRERYPLWSHPGLSIRIFYNDPQEAKEREGKLVAIEREHVLANRSRDQVYCMTEVLDGVQIVGVSKAIEDSGRPVLESYQFLARDIRVLY